MKKTLLSSLLTAFCLFANGQALIKGIVTDQDNRPVVNAAVILKKSTDKTIVQTNIPDSLGNFLLRCPDRGSYIVNIQANGYDEMALEIPTNAIDTFFRVRLSPVSTHLEQVEIRANVALIERRTDRILFNVERSLGAIGGDGIDALSKAPSVRVTENGIQIIGKNDVRVLVNDRFIQLSGVDLMTYLRSIPSANIKRIEIITNPPARYEADGNAGLINIVLKKNHTDGLNGMINTGAILASRYTTGLTGILNYNRKNLHLSNNTTIMHSENISKRTTSLTTPTLGRELDSRDGSRGNGFRTDFRVDYDFSDRTTAGIQLMGGKRDYKSTLSANNRFYTPNKQVLDSAIFTDGSGNSSHTLRSAEAYVNFKLDSAGKKLEFMSSYFSYNTDADKIFKSLAYLSSGKPASNQNVGGDWNNERIEIFTHRLDFTLPSTFATFETGGKFSSVRSNNDLRFLTQPVITSPNNSQQFVYQEQTAALYATAEKETKTWGIKIGLRVEATETVGEFTKKDKNHYFQLFPSLFITHPVGPEQVVSFSYGRRINRPDYSFLNPAKIYSDRNEYFTGNPALMPSFSHNFELNYNYKDWSNTSLYANFLQDGFSLFHFVNHSDRVQYQMPVNFAQSTTFGVSETITVRQKSGWESNNLINVYYDRTATNGTFVEAPTEVLSAYLSTDNTFMINAKKTIMANAVFWYQFPETSSQLKSDAYYAFNLGMRMMMMDRKLTVAANATDLLNTSKINYSGTINGVRQVVSSYRDNRNFKIALIYRFGNNRGNKAPRTSDNSEINRVQQKSN